MQDVIPYEGTGPYLFISYAHADADAVMEVARRLQAEGFPVWYDAGIVVGSEWPEYIASHLAGASAMLAFVSGAYDRSENCRKEMHFALTKKIPTVNIFLERTELSPGLEMQIGSLFALMKYDMPEERFYQKLLAAPQLGSPPPPRRVRSGEGAKGSGSPCSAWDWRFWRRRSRSGSWAGPPGSSSALSSGAVRPSRSPSPATRRPSFVRPPLSGQRGTTAGRRTA